jgi:SAM-dependent methyltransferase
MVGRSKGMAARRPTRLERRPLGEDEIERIRRERLRPRRRQWDYLHLEGLRRSLTDAFADAKAIEGPVLDLFCGTKPYLELMPWQRVWGLDLDRHFGRADVLGSVPLPFKDASFGVVVCTQALHLVDDPQRTVAELQRITRPGGAVIATIPHLFLAEGPFERHWTAEDLRGLFTHGWTSVDVRGIDGPGAALAFILGRTAMLGARRWRLARLFFLPTVLALNAVGTIVDRLARPLAARYPHSLLLTARVVTERPSRSGRPG